MASRGRARGVLLGLAVGDALGTTQEFQRLEAPAFPTLATGSHVDVTGGGPFGVKPGQVTDDTHMACCLSANLKAHGRFHLEDVAQRYAKWTESAFDVGGQTRSALMAIIRGARPADAGKEVWVRSGYDAAGNGSLMRCAPIGVFFAADHRGRRLASLSDSAITHYDPRCQIACSAFNAALGEGLQAPDGAASGRMLAAAEEEIDSAAKAMLSMFAEGESGAMGDAQEALHKDLSAARREDPALYGPELHLLDQQGFVRVAFRLAFWELLHAPSFEAALVDVVNRGGDADTNGAITGALLGAAFGDAEIPLRWSRIVLGALEDERPGPLRDLYHPRQLLRLVDG